MAQVVAVIFFATTFAFLALHLAPGDPATALAEGTPPEVRDRLRVTYGFDQPLLVQYGRWLGAVVRGDLGWSLSARRPVVEVLATALPTTMLLVLPAFALSVVVGMLVGVWQAASFGRQRERWIDRLLLVLYSMPEFWLATTLVLLFARHWHVLPANGITSATYDYLPPSGQLWDRLRHLLLPVVSLSVVGIATFARYQRSSMRQALTQPFVQTARAGGLSARQVMWNTWRAALLPVVTLGGLLLPAYLAGVVFIEQVFAWPGVGTMLVRAVSARDYAVVCGAVIVGSTITALSAALADVLRGVVDPRVYGAGVGAAAETLR
jgi:peptide/nickel transport system permease protein